MLATLLNIVTHGEVMCVVWVLALFTVIQDHLPLSYSMLLCDMVLSFHLCFIYSFYSWY